MATALELETPVFDQKLIKEYTPTIKLMIKQRVFNYDSSDVCHTQEDVYQMCLMDLWNATKIYKPDRGMKFKTFAIFHMQSRLGNFRNKVMRKNKFQTVSMSDLSSGWGITGSEISNEDDSNYSSFYGGYIDSLANGEDAMNEILDAKRVLEQLSGDRKIVFSEYYLKGKKINEICEDYPELTYHQIRRHMKHLDMVYKTLIKGETPCLQ